MNEASLGADIAKALVDDAKRSGQLARLPQAPIGVVGVHGDTGFRRFTLSQAPALGFERRRVLVVGGCLDPNPSGIGEGRGQCNEGRGPGCTEDGRAVRHFPEPAGCCVQILSRGGVWQGGPIVWCKLRQGIGRRIDAGRKIDPVRANAAVTRHRIRQVPAVIPRCGLRIQIAGCRIDRRHLRP